MLSWIDVNRTFQELDLFRREMDRLFSDALRDEVRGGWPTGSLDERAGARMVTTDEAFVLSVDVPGVKSEDIDLQVTREGLTLRAARTIGVPEGYSTHRQERRSWEISRSWNMPVPIDPDHVIAEVKNGVLTITLPKAAEVKPRRITVKA